MLNNGAIKNRTLFAHDNLDILRGIDSDCVDLIYLDPPFNKKKIFTAPTGSDAEGASFSDIFREEDVKEDWLLDIKEDHFAIHNLLSSVRVIEGRGSYNFCYLAYMAIRLMECQRVLKPTGSIYLHCDPTMSHHLKLLLDCIFGEKNFLNEVIWAYRSGGVSKKWFGRKHDILLFYAKKIGKHYFNVSKERSYNRDNKPYRFKGVTEYEDAEGKWYTLASQRDIWDISMLGRTKKERVGYPTQKPLELLERVITASCPEDGIVLDPFCGCATTCVAAERLKRRWVGVDVSKKAFDLVQERMKKEVEWEGSLFAEDLVDFQTSPPARTDMGVDTRVKKYVYIISNKEWKNEWKVGIASNVKKRLNSYQTSDPNRAYVLEYSFLTPNFREIEAFIHERYENRHEWVREPDMQKIVKDIKGFKG